MQCAGISRALNDCSVRGVCSFAVPAASGRLVEDPSNLELLVREDVALQQLVLASMASNTLVVEQAVGVIAAAGTYAGAAKRLVKHNVVQAITDLIYSQETVRQWMPEAVFCG